MLAAAVAVFSERGYRASAMSDGAEAVGIGKASLYHYVGSKEEILVELYKEVLRENEQTLQDLLARGAEAGELTLPTTPTIFANTALGAANWTYKWFRLNGPLTPEQRGAQIADLLLAGLRP